MVNGIFDQVSLYLPVFLKKKIKILPVGVTNFDLWLGDRKYVSYVPLL